MYSSRASCVAAVAAEEEEELRYAISDNRRRLQHVELLLQTSGKDTSEEVTVVARWRKGLSWVASDCCRRLELRNLKQFQ